MRKNRFFIIILVLVFALFLSGCGKADNDEEKSNSIYTNEKEKVSEGEKIVLKIASTLAPGMVSIEALENVAQNVDRRTGGRLEIQIYPSSKLGDQTDYLEGVRIGTVEMCLISPTPLTDIDPRFVVFGCPGFFESTEEIEAFYRTDLVEELFESFRQENGIRFMGLYHEGIRDVWLTKRKIEKVEDFKGIKLRVPDVPLSVKKFQALGTEPVPMTLSEIYTGLETGTVEGIENNVEIITGYNLQDLIKYRVKTNHVYSALILIANDDVIESLPQDLRETLFDCIDESVKEAYENFKIGQEEAYRKVEEAGIITIEMSSEEKEKMNEIWKQVSEEVLDGLFSDSVYEVVDSCKKR